MWKKIKKYIVLVFAFFILSFSFVSAGVYNSPTGGLIGLTNTWTRLCVSQSIQDDVWTSICDYLWWPYLSSTLEVLDINWYFSSSVWTWIMYNWVQYCYSSISCDVPLDSWTWSIADEKRVWIYSFMKKNELYQIYSLEFAFLLFLLLLFSIYYLVRF